jgi:preprotein translocase subunit SecE
MGAQVDSLTPPAEVSKKLRHKKYLQELKDELARVTWTSREELITCTKIVIGTTLVFGLGIYLADLCIKTVVDGLAAVFRLIFG